MSPTCPVYSHPQTDLQSQPTADYISYLIYFSLNMIITSYFPFQYKTYPDLHKGVSSTISIPEPNLLSHYIRSHQASAPFPALMLWRTAC